MSKHSEAFKHFLALQEYCEDKDCDNCCFCLGKDHDNEGYCPFDTYFICPKYIASETDEHEQISKRVYFLEELEKEKHNGNMGRNP